MHACGPVGRAERQGHRENDAWHASHCAHPTQPRAAGRQPPLLARVGRMARVGGWIWELATGEIS